MIYDGEDVLSLFIGKDEKNLREASLSSSGVESSASMPVDRKVELRSTAAEEACIRCEGCVISFVSAPD